MSTVSITPSSYIMYRGTFHGSKSGNSTGSSSASTEASAVSQACSNAKNNATNSASYASASHGPEDITTSSSLIIGSTQGSRSKTIGSPSITSVTQTSLGAWHASAKCSWSSSTSNAYIYQLKIKFNFPSGLTSSNITNATLAFSYTGEGDTESTTFAIAAPNENNELSTFWNTNIDPYSTIIANKVTFDIASLTGSVNLNILEAIQACYTYNQPYLFLRIKRAYPEKTKKLTLDTVPIITLSTDITVYNYTLTYEDSSGEGFNLPSTAIEAGTANTYTFTVSSQLPRREGYKFMGWSTIEGSNNVTHHGGDTIIVNQNHTVTLYAVWSLIYGVGIVNGNDVIPVIGYIV